MHKKIRKQWSDLVNRAYWLPESLDNTEYSKNSYSFAQCHPSLESQHALDTRFSEVLVYNNFLTNFYGLRKSKTQTKKHKKTVTVKESWSKDKYIKVYDGS